MFGADESDQASLDSPVKGRGSGDKAGDSTDLKKPLVSPSSPQPLMLGGGGGIGMSPQQPLSMEPVAPPSNKPTKAGL